MTRIVIVGTIGVPVTGLVSNVRADAMGGREDGWFAKPEFQSDLRYAARDAGLIAQRLNILRGLVRPVQGLQNDKVGTAG